MKLNKKLVKKFKAQQREYGTKTALNNVIWGVGFEIFKILKVRRVNTTYEK